MKTAIAIILLFVSMTAEAQIYKGIQVVFPSLVAGNVQPGKAFTLGIRLKIEPGWHTYWKNPGDAGLPMEATVLDAPNLSVGELRFPTPKKLSSADVATYGYEEEVVYLLSIKPKTPDAAKHFKIKLSWLVCKEVCLPGETVLEFNLDSIKSSDMKENQHLLDRWTARLPQPGAGFNLDKSGATYHIEKNGKLQVFMKFFDVAPGTITDFFPEEIKDFVIDYSKITVSPDGISMVLEPSVATATLTHISGLAIIGSSGYEVDLVASKE
jgi:DsbC/DsbD-like thiol-disulfide interchange protein